MKEEKKEYFKIIEFGEDIIMDDIKTGRVDIPNLEDDSVDFTIYRPNIKEALKNAYKGLFRVWEKQGKNPIEEFKKLMGKRLINRKILEVKKSGEW